MSIHENNNVSMKEIKMALEKNVNSVNERERMLELCEEEIQKHQNPLNILQNQGYHEVVADSISLANGTINKEAIINRIKGNNSLISINFLSVTQAEYQLEKIIEAIDAEINRFTGRECIIRGSCYSEDNELIQGLFIDEPVPESIDEFQYQEDEESTSENNDEFQDKMTRAITVYIVFINAKKGRAQLERLKTAIDAELDKFEEKGLIGSYNSNDKGTETDLTSDYVQEEIRNIEKVHKVQIDIY